MKIFSHLPISGRKRRSCHPPLSLDIQALKRFSSAAGRMCHFVGIENKEKKTS